VVTVHHKRHIQKLGVSKTIEAYIQSRVLKKTLESLSFDQRRGQGEDCLDIAIVEVIPGTC
jgi:hypothetical protein